MEADKGVEDTGEILAQVIVVGSYPGRSLAQRNSTPYRPPSTVRLQRELITLYALRCLTFYFYIAAGFSDTLLSGAESEAAPSSETEPRLSESYKPQFQFRDQPLDNAPAPFIPPFLKFDYTSGPPPKTSLEPSEGSGSGKEDSQEKKRHRRRAKKRKKAASVHPFGNKILKSLMDIIAKERFSADDFNVQKPMHETPFTLVDNAQELQAVAERFSQCTEIAVDLEHHTERSLLGYMCLIQISSRFEDVVVDVMKIPSRIIHYALASIFADPGVTKVLHGPSSDIEWLERDFGLFIVNMFDTCAASRVLQYPKASLVYLLDLYCQVATDEKLLFKTADWSIRPLSKSMINCTRADTHFLLYVYDRLRVELYKNEGGCR